jgi:gliding motility-associated-like protein
LNGGSHLLNVTDGLGCSRDISITVPFPGLVVTSSMSSIAGDCVNGGTIFFFITNPGSVVYQIGYTTDFFNEPTNYSSAYYTPPLSPGDDGFVSISGLTRGDYYIWIKSTGSQCPTRVNSTPESVGGPYQVSFEIGCRDANGDLHLSNIKGAPNTTYNFEIFGNGFSQSGQLTLDPLAQATASGFSTGPYVIWVWQDQTSIAGCNIYSDTLNAPLRALDTVFVKIPLPTSRYEKSYGDFGTASRIVRIQESGLGIYEYRLEILQPFGVDPPSPIIDWSEISNREVRLDNLYSGIYEFSLRDGYGCVKNYQLTIPLDESILIPNIFTPNGDGANDFFEILNLPESGSKLIVSNRWGKEVYSSGNYNPASLWDAEGTPDGVYYYRLSVKGGKTYTGWVEILRGVKP